MYFEEPKHDPVSSAFFNGSSERNFHHLQERTEKQNVRMSNESPTIQKHKCVCVSISIEGYPTVKARAREKERASPTSGNVRR